jgi:hypothetical protein
MGCFGFLKPEAIRLGSQNPGGAVLLRAQQSYVVTVVANTLMSTSLFLGVGFSTSLSWRTSGGPYFSYTIAFIFNPFYYSETGEPTHTG